MFAVIQYSDDEVQGLGERGIKEECLEDLRYEIRTNANGRHYEAVVRHESKTVFYYNSATGRKIDK